MFLVTWDEMVLTKTNISSLICLFTIGRWVLFCFHKMRIEGEMENFSGNAECKEDESGAF